MIKRGSVIGSSRDTGYLLFQNYSKNLKSECVQPVFNEMVKIVPRYIKSPLNFRLEKLLPDKWCYLPKRNNFYSEKGFADTGDPNLLAHGWDEFLWKGKPFGFHMQGAQKDGTIVDHTADLMYLDQTLDYFKNI